MNRLPLLLGILVTTVVVSDVSSAQTAAGDEYCQFHLLGAGVPITLTSRADTVLARMASCAVALVAARRGV
jgi:phosphotransacetylase